MPYLLPISPIRHALRGFNEPSRWFSAIATAVFILSLNGLLLLRLPDAQHLPMRDYLLWLGMNLAIIGCYALTRWHFSSSLERMMVLLKDTSHFLDQPPGTIRPQAPSVPELLQAMTQLSTLVQEQAAKRRELHRELEAARAVLAQCNLQQQAFLRSTNREIIVQYQSVLAYANYLDEHIVTHTSDSHLRFDFDDVCESSFNLKLIAGALELLRDDHPAAPEKLPIASLLQQMMIALAPSLDRRAMRLTTAEVDESIIVLADPVILSQVLWMMLLGLIRYAADESTLRMRCLSDRDGKRAILSIVVSELAPGAMSPEERGAHLLRQLQHGNPPMFAETIKIHGNIQLAELLLKRLEAEISVVPLSAYACEICLLLPLA